MMRKWKGRFVVVVTAAVASLAVIFAPSAFAIGSGITPDNQSIRSGGTAVWGAAWNGNSGDHFNVTFNYGDGTKWAAKNTATTSVGLSHGFFSCGGQTFTQTLSVYDVNTGGSSSSIAYTDVAKGPCVAG